MEELSAVEQAQGAVILLSDRLATAVQGVLTVASASELAAAAINLSIQITALGALIGKFGGIS